MARCLLSREVTGHSRIRFCSYSAPVPEPNIQYPCLISARHGQQNARLLRAQQAHGVDVLGGLAAAVPAGASLAYAPVQARGGASPVGALAGAARRDCDGADDLAGCNGGADRECAMTSTLRLTTVPLKTTFPGAGA